MKELIERIKIEENELDIKYNKLMEFIYKGDIFNTLSFQHQSLLILQQFVMENYKIILKKRIELLEEESEKEIYNDTDSVLEE